MEKSEFRITIAAPKEKVWNTLWNDATYREWTSAFAPGSRAETDWKKGSRVKFLDADNSGMESTIADVRPNEFMSFRHLYEIKKGVVDEDENSEANKQWAGSFENYTLKTVNEKTELTVEMGGAENIPQDLKDFFTGVWPKALEKLKELAEKN